MVPLMVNLSQALMIQLLGLHHGIAADTQTVRGDAWKRHASHNDAYMPMGTL